MSENGDQLKAQYSENKKITDGNYDQSLAVKCVNGTFVGTKTENVIAYKGIPFVDKQPVGELRWKAPVDFTPDDGIYEAYHFARLAVQDLSTIILPVSLFRISRSPTIREKTACI